MGEDREDEQAPLPVLVDAVSLGRAEDAREKPLVRHIIVKDLRKVAARSRVALPTAGLFENRAPLALYAIFDGQSAASEPGPLCAEWCAKQVIPKLLRNISALPQGYENETFIKAVLKKTFEDLDKEVLQGQPAIHDGCGAACALTVGERLFTAVIGKCSLVVCEASNAPLNMGSNQGRCDLPEEGKFLTDNGGVVFEGEGGRVLVQSPTGAVASVSRSLGDRAWKGALGGIVGSSKLLRGAPEVRCTELSWGERHSFIVLAAAPVADAVPQEEIINIGSEFLNRPRAASGEIASKAAVSAEQCTSVLIYLMKKKEATPPPVKKAKVEAESIRLRHILVKHRDTSQPFDPVRNQPVSRSRDEAEILLRKALRELLVESRTVRLPADVNKAKLAALQPTPKYLSLCKELSECTTAQKGGGMCGDLGWLSSDQLNRFGPAFSEIARALGVGHWSDLASSDHGVHLLQRIA